MPDSRFGENNDVQNVRKVTQKESFQKGSDIGLEREKVGGEGVGKIPL